MKPDSKSKVKRLFPVCYVGLILTCCTFAQQPARLAKETAAKSASPDTAPAAPSIDAILHRYIEALGGRAALEKLRSRVTTGTIDVPAMSLSGKIVIREKAPNLFLSTVTISGAAFRQGFDGDVGWTDDPDNGVREQTGPELYEARREADFYHPLHIEKLYSKLNLVGQEKLAERSVYLVEGSLVEGGDPDKLYFDTKTGLITRVITVRHLPEGASIYREDFEDFRNVDGIKLPFLIHLSEGESEYTVKVEEVHHNLEMDDALFLKPAVKVSE
jgi:hypothetical protein